MGKSSFNPNNFSTLALTSYNRKTPVRQVKHENTKKATVVRQRKKICNFITVTIISFIVVGVAIFVTYQRMLNGPFAALVNRECNKLVVLLMPNDTTTKNIRTVFENLDYEVVHDMSGNWNVMWSAQESLNLKTKLKPHQLVNHIPSLSLSVHNSNNNDITTRSFKLPHAKQELMDYIREHPQKRFIIKDCLVDGTRVDVNNIRMNFDASLVLHEMDEKPLLIDGNRFDFGVYFIVTSADPLRIYRYGGDVTARFGIESSAIMEKYFCEELTTMKEIPSLRKFMMIKENSVKNAMEAYLRAMKGKNAVTSLYNAIDGAVVKFLSSKLRAIKKPSSQFFQLMRFDFNLDTTMNLRIKGVDSAIDFENNERLLYEVLRVLGAGNAYDFRSR
jgi:tubulin monoglycylase TTLL15